MKYQTTGNNWVYSINEHSISKNSATWELFVRRIIWFKIIKALFLKSGLFMKLFFFFFYLSPLSLLVSTVFISQCQCLKNICLDSQCKITVSLVTIKCFFLFRFLSERLLREVPEVQNRDILEWDGLGTLKNKYNIAHQSPQQSTSILNGFLLQVYVKVNICSCSIYSVYLYVWIYMCPPHKILAYKEHERL